MVNLAPTLAQVLVVPPFECAWLTGENYLLRDGQGCISFEVKGMSRVGQMPSCAHFITLNFSLLFPFSAGDNDVTVILKPQCGSRRWQHMVSSPRTGPDSPPGRASPVEANYTVILGSHRNSCLKIEKDGELCHMASNIPGSKLSATSFTKFWVSFSGGLLAVGTGEPDPSTVCCSWTDAEPIQNIQFIGLSAWDKHVGYRNIRIHPVVDFSAKSTAKTSPGSPESLPTLVELCCQESLCIMNSQTVCTVLAVTDAIAPVVDGLRARAIEAAAHMLPDILRDDPEGFKGLTVASLADILQYQSLVCGENALFDALVLWAGGIDSIAIKQPSLLRIPSSAGINNFSALNGGYDRCISEEDDNIAPTPQRMLCDVESLLPHIRFPLMTSQELNAVESHPLHAHSALLRELVGEARRGGADRAAASVRADRLVRELTPSEAVASARFQRRSPPGCTQLIYMYDGDHNGVFWHVGTRYGSQKWVNPVLAGLLAVRASSPVARGTDPRALLSGAFLRTNFAGPRREGTSGRVSWWAVDLGPGHALECNYYTLRADGSYDFLRNWALQGSHDGTEWTDLRRHEDDRTFKLPGQYASWPVAGAAATVPYRYFRVFLLGPNSEAMHPHRMCLSNLELYGNFYRADAQEKG